MRSALLFIVLLVPLATAHGEGHETELFVEAFDDDGFYFRIEGYDGKNPTITLTPGTTYSVQFVNRGTMSHNFRVHDLEAFGTPLVAPGGNASLQFTVPTAGLGSYWCDPHKNLDMQGKVVASSEPVAEDAPGASLAAMLGTLALVMTIRRRP